MTPDPLLASTVRSRSPRRIAWWRAPEAGSSVEAMNDQGMAAVPEAGQDGSLIRALGTWGLTAAIVNVTIGAGIFRLPASVAATLGAAATAAYLLCAVAMGLIVL